MKKLNILIFLICINSKFAEATKKSSSAKADLKIVKVECLKSSKRSTDYVATAQVRKIFEGNLDAEIKILFTTDEKNAAVTFLEGDEAIATLHKMSKYWIVNSPTDKQGLVLSSGMLPICK